MTQIDDIWNDTMYAYGAGELSREQVAERLAAALIDMRWSYSTSKTAFLEKLAIDFRIEKDGEGERHSARNP